VELLIRFVIGGVAVSFFALMGDIVRPKTFAGIFGAAPSIALATLALTVRSDGPTYAAIEARSMVVGAVALGIYASCVGRILWKTNLPVALVTTAMLVLWLAVALLGWAAFLQ